MDFIFFVWCQKRSVEHVMNLPRFRKAELISDRGENLDYCEGSFMFSGELGVDNGAFEISGL